VADKPTYEELEKKVDNLEGRLFRLENERYDPSEETKPLWAIIDSAKDAFYLEDSEGRIVYWNGAAVKMFGHTVEEAVGQLLHRLLTPKRFHEDHKVALEELNRTGKYPLDGKTFERTALRKNGEEFQVEASFSTLTLKGKPYVMGIVRDITKRKLAEAALYESEERYRSFSHNFPGITYRGHLNFTPIFFHGAVKDITGYEPEDFIASNPRWDKIVHPLDLDKLREDAKNVASLLDAPVIREYRIVRKDGKTKWIQEVARVISDDSGEPAYVEGIIFDITKQKLTEEGLRFHSEIISNMAEGVYLVRAADSIIVYTNPKFELMFGYAPGEMIGEHVSIVNAPTDEDPEDTARKIMKTLNKTGEWHGEVHNIKKDGTTFWCHANVSFFDHPDFGEVLISIHSDITKRKQAEEQRENLIKKLGQANKELDNFAHTVSHDLKAPIRGIISLVDWISKDYEDKLGEKGKDLIDLLNKRAMKVYNLINGVLNYSKIGYLENNLQDVDLNILIPQVIEIINPPKHIEIKVKSSMPVIFSTKTLIEQLWLNLIDNAVKFIDKPKGDISIYSSDANGSWEFSVKDNGCGIKEKYFDKIFKIYQTVRPLDKHESTGIGLSIVKKIVGLHGGSIRVESKVGEGSTFYFSFPKKAFPKDAPRS
jgi:PAS domain S-box-containing protein